MRIALAILMALHGVAHLVGFAGAWRLAPQGIPYKTTVLAGQIDLGDAGIRLFGLLWLAAGLSFVLAAVGAVVDTEWWAELALVIAVASLVLSVTELPQAGIGIAVNLVVIAVLLAGRWAAARA